MSKTERPAIHAYVCDDSHEGWHTFAAHTGPSVSSLVDALGLELARAVANHNTDGLTIHLDDVIDDAKDIQATNRRRPNRRRTTA